MMRILYFILILLCLNVPCAYVSGADEPPAQKSKKEANGKSADKKDAPFNRPPKGQTLYIKGTIKGLITRTSDGKTFMVEVERPDGKKKEIEINLAAYTKIRVIRLAEHDDKGNAKKPTRDPKDADWRLGGSKGESEDLHGGAKVVLTISGTRDNSWLVAKIAIVSEE